MKPLDELKTTVIQTQNTDLQKEYAKKVAHHLFNYLKSFDSGEGKTGQMVVPVNLLEKWFDKFSKKYDVDPNFVYKTSE